ncbi:MAG: DNA helicase RecG [Armatimonadetes bacterium CG_4_10_14_3_um_filter_66_18]|nr:ATP-dependent DNA helicase RecG [Armatimonadota bacterium]NCO91022.1 ATP-dependent DNA helicase RecG [Armatimonadota bacterium]PIY37236.1 MAG: DNA helicase RecG [Armatimonadetes bacterium CG_4_10_14_3_um_filter_66_18]PIZ38087.1 MAG: DNA helicase RecG [Armatimonadetes bacterium CG_4_10_14_0_8_um_filter_66_14]
MPPEPAVVNRLRGPLRAELKDGCQDRLVIGGVAALVLRVLAECGAAVVGERLSAWFRDYPRLPLPEREARVRAALGWFDGELTEPGGEAIEAPDPSARKPAAAPPQSGSELDSSVQYLKGIGPQRAARLAELGIRTMWDLLRHYPARHEDRSAIKSLGRVIVGAKESVCVRVVARGETERRRGMQITRVPVRDDTGSAWLVWFNQPYRADQFEQGARAYVFGRVTQFQSALQFQQPEFEFADEDEAEAQRPGLTPIYPATQGVYQSHLRRAVQGALELLPASLPDPLPVEVRARLDLAPLGEALRQIHFPVDAQALERARRRLVFEELLLLQTVIVQRRQRVRAEPGGVSFNATVKRVLPFVRSLSFSLTGAQKRVVEEIFADMRSERPMNRLLHGDVGSGKTVVAACALYLAAQEGCQTALMAPTEVLAEQHSRVFSDMLTAHGIQVRLLTGGLAAAERRQVCEEIGDGRTQVIVGTHALIQESVSYHRLGLVVIDEQHRFGVRQRAQLRDKGRRPDVLIMSATPIPRTLALTVYGDLDVSVIDESPPGRRPVLTRRFGRKRQWDRAYEFVKQQLRNGRQAFIICPLVEESEKLDNVKAATAEAERLQRSVFSDWRVGLLHGRLTAAEKEETMGRFRAGELHVLVATTVVEVGVDVPNASVILIQDADRFGLAQLHQLRGRVQRSSHQSYCILLGHPKTDESAGRLQAMVETNDGFRIAETDLQLRGPGEFYGTRQHGMPDLRLADLIRDVELLLLAREEASRLLHRDPELAAPAHQPLAAAVKAFWGAKLPLAEVS